MTSLRLVSVSALATSTRMVCPRTSVASVALRHHMDFAFLDFLQAERRRGPADIDLVGHHGGERGAAGCRSAAACAVSLNSSMKARTTLLVEEPLVEKAMV